MSFALPQVLDLVTNCSTRVGSAACTLVVAAGLSACGPHPGDGLAQRGPIDLPAFAVSDFFTPSGHMGDGEEPGHVMMSADEGCAEPRPNGAAGTCYRFDYGPPGASLWAGVFWAYPANNWGAEPGRSFRPWVFDAASGRIRQRYNRVRFRAAARRDTFELDFRVAVDEAAARVCYALRNATVSLRGPVAVTLASESAIAASPPPTQFTPCPPATALVALPPGNYSVELAPGWSLEADGQPVENPVPPGTLPLSTSGELGVESALVFQAGASTVSFRMSTPPLTVGFFAGGITDTNLVGIKCTEPGAACRQKDNVLSGSPRTITLPVGREWQALTIPSSVLRFDPPCVNNAQDEGPVRNDADATVQCPAGTVTPDGRVASCPLGLGGVMQPDGRIACCDGSPPQRGADGVAHCGTDDFRDPATGEFVSVPKPVYEGSWQPVEAVVGTLIGAFGWSTSYAEFELAAGQLAVDRALVPKTILYLDDIVWDYAAEPLP